MNLFQGDESEILRPEGGLKFVAIFGHVFDSVPFHEAEIEDFGAVESTDAAVARAKAVNEPGQSRKGSELKNLQAARFAEGPGRSYFAAWVGAPR